MFGLSFKVVSLDLRFSRLMLKMGKRRKIQILIRIPPIMEEMTQTNSRYKKTLS